MATLYYRPYTTDLSNDTPTPASKNFPEYILPEGAPAAAPAPTRAVAPAPRPAPAPREYDEEEGDERYSGAVQRMGQDILALRQRLQTLEQENHSLRQGLHDNSDGNKILLDSVELDGLPKKELVGRYVGLKQRLISHEAELATYKAKVQHLQNELIRKNNREEEFIKMSRAHTQQQQILHQLQEKAHKVQKLETEVARQEKLITRLEGQLGGGGGGGGFSQRSIMSGQAAAEESLAAALMEENRRLKSEVNKNKDSARSQDMDGSEKLELYQQLDRAEERIISLEKQLHETSGRWGREKESMTRKLRESEHGIHHRY